MNPNEEAEFKLEQLYLKLNAINNYLRRSKEKELMLTEEEMSLTRYAFNLEREYETV